MIKKMKENFITVSLVVLMVLLVVNAGLIFYNRSVMIEINHLQIQTEEVRGHWNSIFDNNLRRIDLGLRGYALTRNPQLLSPYTTAVSDMPVTLKSIDSLLSVQQLDTMRDAFASFSTKVNEYVAHSERMRVFAEQDSLAAFVRLLNQDKGYDLWQAFAPMYNAILAHQNNLMDEARVRYQRAMNRNVIFQVALVLLVLPTLIGVIYRIRKDGRERKKLLLDFEENNRKYMFNPGTDLPDDDPKVIIQNSIANLGKASTFIKSIASGDYSATWDGLNEGNAALNRDNLTGDLIKMRDQMKKVKETDEKRIWSTEGLAKFSEVARNNQNNLEKLSNEVIRFLTKHMNAQQGSLFLLQDEKDQEPYLQLAACYAFDKKKYVEKRIEIGSGLVGQAFIEGGTVLLTDLPKGYIAITSGLGHATPGCVIIVPMKYNERVEAVLELASFNRFEPHEVEFLEKAGEVIASSISSTKINERTTRLLSETQQQGEALRSQEEELRQNLEEMQATHENLNRASKDVMQS
jgi:CHASE3 domain sensor protein/putative methionine-R-sulfoxide reductase with GAF domain